MRFYADSCGSPVPLVRHSMVCGGFPEHAGQFTGRQESRPRLSSLSATQAGVIHFLFGLRRSRGNFRAEPPRCRNCPPADISGLEVLRRIRTSSRLAHSHADRTRGTRRQAAGRRRQGGYRQAVPSGGASGLCRRTLRLQRKVKPAPAPPVPGIRRTPCNPRLSHFPRIARNVSTQYDQEQNRRW